MGQSVPFAEEAEAGIISVMFKDCEIIQDIVQLVRDTDFYKPENAILLKAILEIDEIGQAVDLDHMTNGWQRSDLIILAARSAQPRRMGRVRAKDRPPHQRVDLH